MTNLERYKTTEEREDAFRQFCKSHRVCDECPFIESRRTSYIESRLTSYGCVLNWLGMEVKEELLPCPFCGGKASASDSGVSVAAYVWCNDCHATTGNFDAKDEAIAAWNRRANNG